MAAKFRGFDQCSDAAETSSVSKLKAEIRTLKRTQSEARAILNQRDQHIADLQVGNWSFPRPTSFHVRSTHLL